MKMVVTQELAEVEFFVTTSPKYGSLGASAVG
jgi:hypothetical protein